MGDGAGRKHKEEEERKRDGEEEGEEEEEKGSLASSLICKKCITSEIKRKITAPKQNTQSRRGKGDGWGRREEKTEVRCVCK